MKTSLRLKHRDLSWLSFNHRVLQEAADERVPLFERIKFLAIFSSNLDEFFRVRVGSLRALAGLKKRTRKHMQFDPGPLLKRIHKVVNRQQEEFGEIYRNGILRELKKHHIVFLREDQLEPEQELYARAVFQSRVQEWIKPVFLHQEKDPPFLHNRKIYLVVQLVSQVLAGGEKVVRHALVEVPSGHVERFIVLPGTDHRHVIMFLDDLLRLCLADIFPRHLVLGVHAIKLTRDAELDIGDEFSGDLVAKVRRALSVRDTGVPARLLYDGSMTKETVRFLQDLFRLGDQEMIPGARYHNFSDLFSLQNPKAPALAFEPHEPLKGFPESTSIFASMAQKDTLLYFPYHDYSPVVRFLQEAANDPAVHSVKITLYRVAARSRIVEQLLRAAQNNKEVSVFVEVKARFDEESNIHWAEELEKAGARVYYSFPGLKVHAKLCLVSRMEGDRSRLYAFLSTGNFNEKAATSYTDFGLFTTRKKLTSEVDRVFDILCRKKKKAQFHHILVAPFAMRKKFEDHIRNEIKNARKGRDARIIAKMNSLEDPAMIALLYKAGSAGVKVDLIVRGICCLIPGVEGMSENISIRSIVDRYLEHARVFWFSNDGSPLCYLSSADWMVRNLDRRIEVAFPLDDPEARDRVRAILELQLSDTVKARVIDKGQRNRYVAPAPGCNPVRSQVAIHEMLKISSGRLV